MSADHQPTILIIDDDSSLRDSLRRTLRGTGYSILDAPEGGLGLKLMQTHSVDIVLVDIYMPGKEGVETIRELRRGYPHTKIIAMSGGGQKGGIDVLLVAKALGCKHTLVKPFSKEELLNALEAQPS